MSARLRATLVCLGIGATSVGSGSTAEPAPAGPGPATVATRGVERSPRQDPAGSTRIEARGAERRRGAHPRLSERLREKLDEALPIAREQLREHSSCRALFARLGADGAAMLQTPAYYPASAEQEGRYCRRGASAVTSVGGSVVVLCRSFGRLSRDHAAIILLHEALHLAGQTESPLEPKAPDAFEITRKVMTACRLF